MSLRSTVRVDHTYNEAECKPGVRLDDPARVVTAVVAAAYLSLIAFYFLSEGVLAAGEHDTHFLVSYFFPLLCRFALLCLAYFVFLLLLSLPLRLRGCFWWWACLRAWVWGLVTPVRFVEAREWTIRYVRGCLETGAGLSRYLTSLNGWLGRCD